MKKKLVLFLSLTSLLSAVANATEITCQAVDDTSNKVVIEGKQTLDETGNGKVELSKGFLSYYGFAKSGSIARLVISDTFKNNGVKSDTINSSANLSYIGTWDSTSDSSVSVTLSCKIQ